MTLISLFIITIILLIGTFFLTALNSALRRFHRRDSKKHLEALGNLFYYRPFHLHFFPDYEYEDLVFAVLCTQNIVRYSYAVFATIFLFETPLIQNLSNTTTLYDISWLLIFLGFLSFAFLSFIVGEYIPRIIGARVPEKTLYFTTPIASVFLYLSFPFTYLFLKISHSFSRVMYFDNLHEGASTQAKQEIIDIIQKAQLTGPEINPHDKKLIESVLSFRERIAREVMVPRVDVFSLSAETSIKEASKELSAEGFSRIPIYRNTVDNIVGVLMYKDLIAKYIEYEEKNNDPKILEAPIETIQKNVLYTPETKKISNLLQEFRKKQVHLAIVVDEYGGTEGIVTIEDILEEIVGDIADEYDQEEKLYTLQPDGSWIVDARMSIFDADELLGIEIPQESDYDTIGGYVFHQSGSIPPKGFIIHQDNFDMEVIDSNERVVEKVRVKPIRNENRMEDFPPASNGTL